MGGLADKICGHDEEDTDSEDEGHTRDIDLEDVDEPSVDMLGVWEIKWAPPERDPVFHAGDEMPSPDEFNKIFEDLAPVYPLINENATLELVVPVDEDVEPHLELKGSGILEGALPILWPFSSGVVKDLEARDGEWSASVVYDSATMDDRVRSFLKDVHFKLKGTYDAESAHATCVPSFPAPEFTSKILYIFCKFGYGWTLTKLH